MYVYYIKIKSRSYSQRFSCNSCRVYTIFKCPVLHLLARMFFVSCISVILCIRTIVCSIKGENTPKVRVPDNKNEIHGKNGVKSTTKINTLIKLMCFFQNSRLGIKCVQRLARLARLDRLDMIYTIIIGTHNRHNIIER